MSEDDGTHRRDEQATRACCTALPSAVPWQLATPFFRFFCCCVSDVVISRCAAGCRSGIVRDSDSRALRPMCTSTEYVGYARSSRHHTLPQ